MTWVRGVGCVSALGPDWTTTADRLAAGATGVSRVERFDVRGFDCQTGAPVCSKTVSAEVQRRNSERPPEDGAMLEPRVAMTWLAATEAWAQAGLDTQRVGVFIGAESGFARYPFAFDLSRAAGGGRTFDHEAFAREGEAVMQRAQHSDELRPAAAVAARFGFDGPVGAPAMACASGLAAVVEGVRSIAAGECDAAICGGVGAGLDPLLFGAFDRLGALSPSGVARPFDRRRDGFVLGEGAACVVLGGTRGPSTPVRVAGWGRGLDAHHLTDPDPDGVVAEATMRTALGGQPVQYVQAHGTATAKGDSSEARALYRLFGDDVPIGSVKGALGHWIAGAGAVGLLCAIEAVSSGGTARGRQFPTVGFEQADAGCPGWHLRETRDASVQAALVNAFGFGGGNVSVRVERVS